MNTGISRFVLISAALHLGLLGAVNFHWTRPQLLPAVLSVTLDGPSAVTASSFNRMHTLTRRSTSVTTTRGDGIATYNASTPIPEDTESNDAHHARIDDDAFRDVLSKHAPNLSPVSSSLPVREEGRGEVTKDQSDVSDPHSNLSQEYTTVTQTNFLTPPGESSARGAKPWPAGPDEGAGFPDIAERATIHPDQQLDAATLSSQLEGQLRNALAPYFTYPLMARRKGWEGQVQVGLRVEADGRLSHVRIAHSSGYRALDSAALATLGRISILPAAAGWLDGRHFDMVLPIDYRLIDGQS